MMINKEESIIYGVRTGNTYHYIGKTAKGRQLAKSALGVMYTNPKLNEIFVENQEVSIVQLKNIDGKWYDEKLEVVLEKHNENHPLRNAQWMLDGKHGYWSDKIRDPHTLKRLSESKNKRVVEYNADGNLKEIWNSGREVGLEVFGDYCVVNGAGKTSLYSILKAPALKNRLRHGSYWFWERELQKQFNCIPKRLNVEKIIKNQRELRYKRCCEISKTKKRGYPKLRSRYTVNMLNQDGTIKETFDDIQSAALVFKVSVGTLKRIISEGHVNKYHDLNLKYGEKVRRLVIPKAEIKSKPTKRKSSLKGIAPTTRVRSCYSIEWYIGGELFRTFESITKAAEHFGVSKPMISKIIYKFGRCSLKEDLRKGERKRINI